MSLFPAWGTGATWTRVTELLTAMNVPDPVWYAFTSQAGDPGDDIRLLAALPRVALTSGCNVAVLPDGSTFTPMQATQLGLLWGLARRVAAARGGAAEQGFEDIDPWAETPSPTVSVGTAGTGMASQNLKDKVLKMNSVTDQQDDSELQLASNSMVNRWMQNYMTPDGHLAG